MAPDTRAPKPAARKPYRKPTLIVHGNLKTLTEAKGGINLDGSGKPRTRLFGGNT